MDINNYIESGVIEAYVLGLASAEEITELNQLRSKHPEINRAIIEFEKNLEKTTQADSIPPPAFIKDAIKQKLFSASNTTLSPEPAKIVPIRKNYWKQIAAAAVVVLIGSAALNFYFYKKYKNSDTAYNELLAETRNLAANNKIINTRLDNMQASMQWIVNPAVQKVDLPGVGERKQYSATVYWNADTKEVYFLPANLPAAPSGKQYQLWALVNGKPIDAGMVDRCVVLCRMKTTPVADAFAITLENAGGSPEPHLDQLYVLGQTTP